MTTNEKVARRKLSLLELAKEELNNVSKASKFIGYSRLQRCHQFKHLIRPKLSLRNYNAQVGEILAGVKVMNKLIGLGMPVRQPVN